MSDYRQGRMAFEASVQPQAPGPFQTIADPAEVGMTSWPMFFFREEFNDLSSPIDPTVHTGVPPYGHSLLGPHWQQWDPAEAFPGGANTSYIIDNGRKHGVGFAPHDPSEVAEHCWSGAVARADSAGALPAEPYQYSAVCYSRISCIRRSPRPFADEAACYSALIASTADLQAEPSSPFVAIGLKTDEERGYLISCSRWDDEHTRAEEVTFPIGFRETVYVRFRIVVEINDEEQQTAFYGDFSFDGIGWTSMNDQPSGADEGLRLDGRLTSLGFGASGGLFSSEGGSNQRIGSVGCEFIRLMPDPEGTSTILTTGGVSSP